MKLSWTQLAEALKAEFAGGDMIAFVDGKRCSLGRKVNGTVVLTPLGERLSFTTPYVSRETPVVAKPAPAPAPKARRTRKPKVEVVPDAQT